MSTPNITINRLHTGSTYHADKAIRIAAQLNCEELGDDGNYKNGEFVGFVYSADIKGAFGRIKVTDADGEFVGYF